MARHYLKPLQYQIATFTKREKEIIVMLSKGFSSKEIGDALSISTHTVSAHRINLLSKYNFANTTELSNYGLVNGIVSSISTKKVQ